MLFIAFYSISAKVPPHPPQNYIAVSRTLLMRFMAAYKIICPENDTHTILNKYFLERFTMLFKEF
jgi:hypothetical protein